MAKRIIEVSYQNDFVEILHPKLRVGPKMHRTNYESLCAFILNSLMKNEHLTLNDLIERAIEQFGNIFKGDLSWSLLQVKLDLETRGLISVSLERKRVQVISARKSALKKFIKSETS